VRGRRATDEGDGMSLVPARSDHDVPFRGTIGPSRRGEPPVARPQDAGETVRRSRTEIAADRLREMIVTGALPPGRHLAEVALARRLGVSRTPVREALKLLAREGLVEIEPHRGARVAPLRLDELARTVEVMRALERLVGTLAVARAGAEEVAAVCRAHREMMAAWRRRQLEAYFAANQAVHLGLVRATGNPVLCETYGRLNARIRRYRFMANLDPHRWAEAVAEHERILELFLAREGEALGELLAEHLDHKLAALAAARREADRPRP